MWKESTTATPVAAVPPNATVEPVTNPVPVIVTDVPPVEGPVFGADRRDSRSHRGVGELITANCGDVPALFVTRTCTAPGVIVDGDVAVIDVELFTSTPVAAVPPNATVEPVTKLLPVMVTDVPPSVGPELGLTDVTTRSPCCR